MGLGAMLGDRVAASKDDTGSGVEGGRCSERDEYRVKGAGGREANAGSAVQVGGGTCTPHLGWGSCAPCRQFESQHPRTIERYDCY